MTPAQALSTLSSMARSSGASGSAQDKERITTAIAQAEQLLGKAITDAATSVSNAANLAQVTRDSADKDKVIESVQGALATLDTARAEKDKLIADLMAEIATLKAPPSDSKAAPDLASK